MAFEIKKGYQILDEIEAHTGEKINNKRLRLHIASELQRRIDHFNSLYGRMGSVLEGFETYDPKKQKAISVKNK